MQVYLPVLVKDFKARHLCGSAFYLIGERCAYSYMLQICIIYIVNQLTALFIIYVLVPFSTYVARLSSLGFSDFLPGYVLSI